MKSLISVKSSNSSLKILSLELLLVLALVQLASYMDFYHDPHMEGMLLVALLPLSRIEWVFCSKQSMSKYFFMIFRFLVRICQSIWCKVGMWGMKYELEGGVVNLQNANDTILFLQAQSKMIEAWKWILFGFENLRSNFDKSMMVGFNITEESGSFLANIIGCTFTNLPITYLFRHTLALETKSSYDYWQLIIQKIEKRLKGRKGKCLSRRN